MRQGRRTILLTGGSGFLGSYLWPCLEASHELVNASRRRPSQLPESVAHVGGDLCEPLTLTQLESLEADVVVHLAALTDADRCEIDPELARRTNELAAGALARTVAKTCRRFIYVSTDLVFDGESRFYKELDEPNPISCYGRTKLAGERAVRDVLGERLVVARLALLYGPRRDPGSRPSFAESTVLRAREGAPVVLFIDQFRTPCYAQDAAEGLRRLVELERVPSLVHLGGPERCSRYEMGRSALEVFGLPSELAVARRMDETASRARRPRDVSLSIELARRLGLPARPLRVGLVDMRRQMERGAT